MKKVFLHLGVIAAMASVIGLTACGGGSSVTNVALGGTVTGLTTDGLVLTNNFALVAIPANAKTFLFPGRTAVGTGYSVSVQKQPTGQTCSIANGMGIAGTSDINIQVSCAPNHQLGGSINGLSTNGLALANGSDVVRPAAGDTTFVFPTKVGEGTAYGVTILTQPSPQTCSVVNGSGYMAQTDVTNVQINCL